MRRSRRSLGFPNRRGGISICALLAICGNNRSLRCKPAAPSFEYDSASLGEDDRSVLGLVAKCLTEGALRGRSVALIGRADPRGEPEYNMNLGGSRADSVRGQRGRRAVAFIRPAPATAPAR